MKTPCKDNISISSSTNRTKFVTISLAEMKTTSKHCLKITKSVLQPKLSMKLVHNTHPHQHKQYLHPVANLKL